MSKTLFGVHTGQQNCRLDDLRQVWHLADRSGFHWVSIWDHGRNEAEAQAKRQGLQMQFGSALSFMEPGMLIGTPQEVIDRIGAYVHGGAEWIILALRAPFDIEGLQIFIDTVMPAFKG